MKCGFLIRFFICVSALGSILYLYIREQNAITKLRLQIPTLQRELEQVRQEEVRLQFEIDRFESPLHLMELARQPEYRHLKHPRLDEIINVESP